MTDIAGDVAREMMCQVEKWGVQAHDPATWLAILVEEVGEVANAMLEGTSQQYRRELVQVAAVAMKAIECLDRGNSEWRRDG